MSPEPEGPEQSPDPAPEEWLARLESARRVSSDPLEALARTLLLGKTPSLEDALALQGQRLDGYLLVRLLGLGGMGATYEAVNDGGRRVALKVVDALTAEGRDRFENECRILRKLAHPAIVGYLDHRVLSDGRAFLVMELVAGQSLLHYVDQAPPGVDHDEVLNLLATVAEALHHAHERGVVHRDIKPQNVLIGPDLEPVVIDFGLSRDLFLDQTLTRSGAIMGTFSYMAPEQLRGEGDVGPAADVFALGLLLYRTTMGEDLRQQPSEVMAHANRPFLLPRAAARVLPRAVQAILYRALDPRPSRRYASAAAMAEDLRAAAEGRPVQARVPLGVVRVLRMRSARVLLVCCVVLLGLLAVGIALAALIEPYTLSVSAINTPGIVSLDGRPLGNAPFERLEIEPGDYTLGYSADGVLPLQMPVHFDRKHNRVNLPTISLRPSSMPIVAPGLALTDGVGLLHLQRPESPPLRHLLDGKPLDPAFDWFALPPGPHELRAATLDGGLEEVQSFDVAAGQLHDVSLLPQHLLDRRGGFRVTMQSLLSPRPPQIVVEMDDGAAILLGTFDPTPKGATLGPGLDKLTRCDTYVAPVVAGRWLHAEVRVDFPKPMISVHYATRCEVVPGGGELEVATRCDDGAWVVVAGAGEGQPRGHTGTFTLPGTEKGVSVFRLRARMKVPVASHRESGVIFLGGMINNSRAYGPQPPLPAFGVVADPQPGLR